MNKAAKARKYNSSKLQLLMDEVSPLEMEQTKNKMQIAARIEDLMKGKGWSKSQFAEKLGKNPSEITKWLSGTQNFTTDVLSEIAFSFNIGLVQLLAKPNVQTVYKTSYVAKILAAETIVHYQAPSKKMNSYKTIYSISLPVKQSPHTQQYHN
jgi:transcriptional regulator with XRE-family HTH domain